MKKVYTLIAIEDVVPKDRVRRMVKAFVHVREVPEREAEKNDPCIDDILELAYPAYGGTHYFASIDYFDKIKGQLNHYTAQACSALLKPYWRDFGPEEDHI